MDTKKPDAKPASDSHAFDIGNHAFPSLPRNEAFVFPLDRLIEVLADCVESKSGASVSYEALKTIYEALRGIPSWIPVTPESLPKEGEWVLLESKAPDMLPRWGYLKDAEGDPYWRSEGLDWMLTNFRAWLLVPKYTEAAAPSQEKGGEQA